MAPIHLISIISFAISSNFDNIGVGVAYGIRGTCISFLANCAIASINSFGTLVSMIIGASVARMFESHISGAVGGLILIAVGVWVGVKGTWHLDREVPIEDELRARLERLSAMNTPRRIWEIIGNPFAAHPDCRESMGLTESFVIGLGLTMTNIVTGFSAGMMGLNITLLTLMTMLFSILAIWLGRAAGNARAFHWLGRYSGAVSGGLLIAIGTLEMLA